MQIRHKNLPVEVCQPAQQTKTPEFRAAYPLGKIPALELDDGQMIGESTAIMNYLEAGFPEPPMRPSNSIAQAHNEMLIRYTDNHLSMGLSPLFQEFFGLVHARQKPEPNPNRFNLLLPELQKLDEFLEEIPSFNERDLQTGDLCLIGNLYYVTELCRYFGKEDVLDGHPNINAWRDWVMRFPAVAHEVAVMDRSHQALIQSLTTDEENV